MKKVAVVVRTQERTYEALRSSLGCLLEDHQVGYFVIGQEISPDEAFLDNLGFLEEMGGRRYSDQPANAAQFGFTLASLEEMGELLRDYDIIIPF